MTDEEPTNWLQLAEDSFTSSTNYLNANLRKQFERNIALFQSKHPNGSKYNSEAYRKRSRLFRPKTKSVVRKNEAAAAAAFFANVDVVSVEAQNDADQVQNACAELMGEVLNYRLTHSVPWFITLLGALQEAQVIGIVASYQYWKYAEKVTQSHEPVLDDLGQPLTDAAGNIYAHPVETVETITDEPCVELVPVENLRFDPGAEWTNVVGSSPYIIRMVPMYVGDLKAKMRENDPKTGQPKWRSYTDDEIRSVLSDTDSTRDKREGRETKDTDPPLVAFDIVWCHENFMRIDGQEVVYWTLGTKYMLTDPMPLEDAYFSGKRPFVIGFAVLEAHRAIPDSLVAIGSELQKEANDIVNQRMDNVRLVLNKRWIAKRNAQVDIPSLLANVPGAVTLANEVEDVREVNWPDVTASAYQEQDRLNVDFDELTGNFSQGSVMTNRKLNETVGGMQMMGGSANQMTEYLLRTFVETWVEPVLNQLVALEQHYETDETVLMVAGSKAGLPPPVVQQLMQAWQDKPMSVTVNVGMGATDPHTKLQKFTHAAQTYAGIMSTIPDADPEAVKKEVFGLAGYRDGARFFRQADNPANAQMMQQMQQMQQALQEMGQKVAKQELQLADKSGSLQIAAFDAETKRLQVTKPETANNGPTAIDAADAETKRISAVADARLKDAQIDLVQAQATKTVVDAALAPSQAMAAQATNVE